LTEDGEIYLEAVRAALDGFDEAEAVLSARRDEPVRRVRLDLPIGFGRLLLPTFACVRERHPKHRRSRRRSAGRRRDDGPQAL
jgi:DNA-binding transcriptional LysR family regulator